MKRGQLFWGGVLVLVGALMLAGEMGIRLPNGDSLMSLFFPLLLVGLGAWVLISVFVPRNYEAESASVGLQNAREAVVNISHGAGVFRLHSGASGNDLLNGTFVGGLDQKSTMNGDKLEVRMRPANDFDIFPVFGPHRQLDWNVSLNPAIPTALDMNMGADKSEIDLRDLNIKNVHFKSGASDTVMTLPARGRLNLDCEVGATSLTLVVPEGVAIRAHATMGVGEFKVDRSRFPNDESPDFATAENAVDIRVRGGAASVKVR